MELDNSELGENHEGDSADETREVERIALLNRVVSGNIQSLKDRVAFILNNSIDARNSDKELAWAFWRIFDKDKFDGRTINKEEFKALSPYSSVIRERAKIQNGYQLFQADKEVQQFRGVLEDEKREEAIDSDLTGLGLYSVYMDETGKTQDYLSIGSLWILKSGYESWQAAQQLTEWKKSKGIKHEFHFTELSKGNLDNHIQFFEKFLALHPEASFKIVTLAKKGLADIDKAVTDLTVHLLIKGIDHENTTGVGLPFRVSCRFGLMLKRKDGIN